MMKKSFAQLRVCHAQFFKRARQNSVANILAGGGLVRPNDIV